MTREEQIKKYCQRYCDTRGFTSDGGFDIYSPMAIVAEDAIKWADEHPKSSWISVEERLPENSDRCFVASGRPGCLDVAYYDKFKEVWVGVTGPYDLLGVAYWMPVPKFEEE